jgi:hypothetical protein
MVVTQSRPQASAAMTQSAWNPTAPHSIQWSHQPKATQCMAPIYRALVVTDLVTTPAVDFLEPRPL